MSHDTHAAARSAAPPAAKTANARAKIAARAAVHPPITYASKDRSLAFIAAMNRRRRTPTHGDRGHAITGPVRPDLYAAQAIAVHKALPGLELLTDQNDTQPWPATLASLAAVIVLPHASGAVHRIGMDAAQKIRDAIAAGVPVLIISSRHGLHTVVDCRLTTGTTRSTQDRVTVHLPRLRPASDPLPTLKAALDTIRADIWQAQR